MPMAQRKPRAVRVTKEQVQAHAISMATFDVRWSRPGMDQVRVGKGYAVGVGAKDGSLTICNFLTGGIHSIMPEYVDRRVRIKTKRTTRQVWQKWTEDDTLELLTFVTAKKLGDKAANLEDTGKDED